jgi:hypothetical protein
MPASTGVVSHAGKAPVVVGAKNEALVVSIDAGACCTQTLPALPDWHEKPDAQPSVVQSCGGTASDWHTLKPESTTHFWPRWHVTPPLAQSGRAVAGAGVAASGCGVAAGGCGVVTTGGCGVATIGGVGGSGVTGGRGSGVCVMMGSVVVVATGVGGTGVGGAVRAMQHLMAIGYGPQPATTPGVEATATRDESRWQIVSSMQMPPNEHGASLVQQNCPLGQAALAVRRMGHVAPHVPADERPSVN